MRSSRASRIQNLGTMLLAGASALALLASPAHAAKPAKKAPAPPPLPPAPARLRIIAPTMTGPWTMRIDNEGTVPLRVPADVRLLRLEVEVAGEKKPIKCEVPKSLRPSKFPESRALLLGPGQSYAEPFDPRLFCFGKAASALQSNAVVHARFGWDPPKKYVKKPPKPPFAAESTEREPTLAPEPELRAPAILLGDAPPPPAPAPAQPAPAAEDAKKEPATQGAPAPIVDERAGRLVVSSETYRDLASPHGATLKVTAKNDGLRPILVALRPWMFSFRVDGPYGTTNACPNDPPRGLPRDAFRTLEPGASTSFSIVLSEVCPRDTFTRPGLYRVTPTLNAGETASGIDAYTAEVKADKASLVRLAAGPEAFYLEPPRALPAPPPPAPDATPAPASDAEPAPPPDAKQDSDKKP